MKTQATAITPDTATDNSKLAAIPLEDKELNQFISERELLKRLPVSRRTLHTWRMSGKIPSIKIGRRVLFCWNNVADALRRLERSAQN